MKYSSDEPLTQPVPARRRRALIVTAGAVAAVAGIGLALRHQQQDQSLAARDPVQGFWAMQWQTPQGQTLNMKSFQGCPLLLNFWATWCPPCVQELPLLNAFYRQNARAGWQVFGLAVDSLAPVQDFLSKQPLDFPVALAGLAGIELSRSLGNLSGGLPFSVVIGSDGDVVQRKMGQIHAEDLQAWVRLE